MKKRTCLIGAVSTAILAGTTISFSAAIGSPALSSNIELAMAKTPKENKPVAAGSMNRYIVEHRCKKSDVSKIADAVGGEPYQVLTVFEFTNQFLIETTGSGISRLKKHRCVKNVNEDTAVPPASSG